MNFSFFLIHDNLVVETLWFGDLTGEIIVAGVIRHNNWIIKNSDTLPLVLLFDFTKASLEKVSEMDLQIIKDHFRGLENVFPGVNWIGIMPSDVKYSTVKMWLDHAENIPNNSYIVKNRLHAEDIILSILNPDS